MTPLPLGKLSSSMLEELLNAHFPSTDPRVAVGPMIGEDAAVIDFGDRYLVAKTDPITFATDEIGWYAVHVNANDLAVRGAKPRWFQASVLLPENRADRAMVEKIFSDIAAACRELGVSVIGGHTEVTHGLDRPLIAGCMLGEVEKEKLVTTSGARAGDCIVITKGIAVEGTSIIAAEKEGELRARGYDEEFITRARAYVHTPGISVVGEALLASEHFPVHAMHDPTEGGLANGLYEIARASGTGMVVERDAIPVLPESSTLCREFGLDPLGTLTSGTLIVTLPGSSGALLVDALGREGIAARVIGTVTDGGFYLKEGDMLSPLPHSEKDEITRIFE